MKLRCGLLGKTLKHSYSPQIHNAFGEYEYRLYEKSEDELPSFLKSGDFDGINVTIPYKKTVMPFLDVVSEVARKVGSVNTVVKKDGLLYGDNTDVYGFEYLVRDSGYCVAGKKGLVLGSGGASAAVNAALTGMGAQTVVISRSGENNYENLYLHADADFIVNTTPVGMYPNVGAAPVDLRCFPRCEFVFDIIYNPARTALMLQAEELSVPCAGGLKMLVAQAQKSSEQFTRTAVSAETVASVIRSLEAQMKNIVLIGMPGSGKTSIGGEIAAITGRKFIDSDAVITERTGKTPAQIITEQGEEAFRAVESEIIASVGKESGAVIATGGGVVTRRENYPSLHRNGTIIWIKRSVDCIDVTERPLSRAVSRQEMLRKRAPLYKSFCDAEISLGSNIPENAKAVLEAIKTLERIHMKILVINGPNINMLGIREPHIYGGRDYKALTEFIEESAAAAGVEVECYQSNHEGDIVGKIQDSLGVFDGIVINPAAYTHTSVAILDALKAVSLPAVEVHISDVNNRDDFRRISYAGMACIKTFSGLGFEGYNQAIITLKQYLSEKKQSN